MKTGPTTYAACDLELVEKKKNKTTFHIISDYNIINIICLIECRIKSLNAFGIKKALLMGKKKLQKVYRNKVFFSHRTNWIIDEVF